MTIQPPFHTFHLIQLETITEWLSIQCFSRVFYLEQMFSCEYIVLGRNGLVGKIP